MAKPKLLIVEDDVGLCNQYRWAFPDYETLFAQDRRQALAAVQRDQPKLAIRPDLRPGKRGSDSDLV